MLDDVLVEATGILQKNISKYETRAVFLVLETLERIAKTLKKPFGYFLDE
jgi:transcriptional regulator with XRE-family HTH domain